MMRGWFVALALASAAYDLGRRRGRVSGQADALRAFTSGAKWGRGL